MNETQWDIKEIKHLRKKLLFQYNFVMLLLLVLIGYFAENGKTSLLIDRFCVLSWIIVAITLYNLKTGKPLGTKTSRMMQEFDRNHLEQKRWKRRTMIEAVITIIISVFITVLLFVKDFNSGRVDFPILAFPFIGAWVGYNIGEIFRISNL